jgi:hypothetical protein
MRTTPPIVGQGQSLKEPKRLPARAYAHMCRLSFRISVLAGNKPDSPHWLTDDSESPWDWWRTIP